MIRAALAVALLMVGLGVPAHAASGPLTDQQFQSFTGSRYTSRYHLYAAGLDWSKPVGLLVYADGSGEYGLKNPTSRYLLGGTNGLRAVAKRNNMILLTPFAPNRACADGDGSCWYMGDTVGYARWAEELVTWVQGRYPINRSRVVVGGYSSGAQLTTEWWIPSGAAQRTSTDLAVAISYGGTPKMTFATTDPAFKAGLHITWDVGTRDPSYKNDGNYGVSAGHAWYTSRGWETSLVLVSGEDHDRDGQFGLVMEREIRTNL